MTEDPGVGAVLRPTGDDTLTIRREYLRSMHARNLGGWCVIGAWIVLGT